MADDPTYLIPPQIDFRQPLEALLDDHDLDALQDMEPDDLDG